VYKISENVVRWFVEGVATSLVCE